MPRAVITHGHGDHARPGHRKALATPETLAIMRTRFQDMPDTEQQPLKYGESVRIGDVDVGFAPAGHILGSAQAVLAYRGQRIVVSGDFKRRPDPTCPPFEPVPCDVFITEATFALPVFHHPSDAGEIGKLLRSVATFPERTHLVGVYALGKCQRVIRLLRQAGYDKRIWLHGGLMSAVQALPGARRRSRRRGARLRRDPRNLQGRHRALPALGPRRPLVAALRRSDRRRVLRLDGRAGPRAPTRRGAALVISDHADWPELTQTLKDVGAPKVWVTHGREEALVHYARSIGIDAEALHLAGREEEES